ncbi:MAG TPA: hypothetical protein VJH20_01040, partial [Candidatus Nanoarchaeia archaeon]|nr:hypothetical protein [Candidatus Nanoarchaeia archaeon]
LGCRSSGTFTPTVIINNQSTQYILKLVATDSQGLSGNATKTLTINPIIQQTCTDSDGGRNYEQLGTTSDGTLSRTDQCKNRNNLREYYCSGNSVTRVTVDCRSLGFSRCSNGICIRSSSLTSQSKFWSFFSRFNRSPGTTIESQPGEDNIMPWVIIGFIFICGLIYLERIAKNIKRKKE